MNFASKFVIHENSLGSFTCLKAGTWDIFFYFPSEGRHTEDFPDARQIQRLRPGLNSRTRVPVASMLTTRPPKPSHDTLTFQPLLRHFGHRFSDHFLTNQLLNPRNNLVQTQSLSSAGTLFKPQKGHQLSRFSVFPMLLQATIEILSQIRKYIFEPRQ